MNMFLSTKLSSSFVYIVPLPQCCFKFRLVNYYRLQIQIASVALVQQQQQTNFGSFQISLVVLLN